MNNDNKAVIDRQDRIIGQIAVFKTEKKVLDIIDGLNSAPIQDYAAIHAGMVRPYEKDGKRVYSVIKLIAQENGYGESKSIRATANISPNEALYLFHVLKSGVKEFKFEAVKIFGNSDNGGYCPMSKLWITRNEVTTGGGYCPAEHHKKGNNEQKKSDKDIWVKQAKKYSAI